MALEMDPGDRVFLTLPASLMGGLDPTPAMDPATRTFYGSLGGTCTVSSERTRPKPATRELSKSSAAKPCAS